MQHKTSPMYKIKEVMAYTLILCVGLGIGLAVKEGWTMYNKTSAYVEMDTTAHFANTTEKVVLYTTAWCPYCKKTKQYLTDNNIAFEERDIEKGSDQITQLYSSIGIPGIPKIVIGNKVINGFNPSLFAQELKQQALM